MASRKEHIEDVLEESDAFEHVIKYDDDVEVYLDSKQSKPVTRNALGFART